MVIHVLREAGPSTRVLLLHAPYPGKLKFQGQPSGLLAAVSVYAHRLASEFRLDELSWLDPGIPTGGYRERFAELVGSPSVRVLCISTTNAAIEETAWAVAEARKLRGPDLFVLVGGPHEDDCSEKAAHRIPGVDLSVGGDAEFVLDFILHHYDQQGTSPAAFAPWLLEALPDASLRGSRVTVSAPPLTTLVLDLPKLEPADLVRPLWTTKRVRFSVFPNAAETLPVLISRGCSYGKCTFCAEPNQAGARVVREDFDWLEELVEEHPRSAVYFQDSIFPKTPAVEHQLLPMLKKLGVEWGAQVYLRALSRPWLERLRKHGCTYLYTGLESGSAEILAGIGKTNMHRDVALERLVWMRDLGFRVGLLPAAEGLTLYETMLAADPMGVIRVQKSLRQLRGSAGSLTIVDTPPTLGVFTFGALAAADWAVIPTECEEPSIRTLPSALQTVREAQSLNPALRVLAIVATSLDRRTLHGLNALETLKQAFPTQLASTVVPRATAITDSMRAGADLDPRSPAHACLLALTTELSNRMLTARADSTARVDRDAVSDCAALAAADEVATGGSHGA